jgi:glycosyltransferase involved in cell wall biosynthesis
VDANNIVYLIMVCYRQGPRAKLFQKSINSLIENTTYPYELILTDNTWNNRGLGAARNQGIKRIDIADRLDKNPYIAIVDDDILYEPKWLEACIEILQIDGGKDILATPIHIDRHRAWWKKHDAGEYQGYTYHRRSGSNCMVMTWETFIKIGYFDNIHPSKDGVKWCDRVVRKGIKPLLTKKPLAFDMAFNKHSYKGYIND